MPDFRVTVVQTFGAPEGTTLLPNDAGLRLPTGEVLRPWLVIELNAIRDVAEAELGDFGVEPGLDIERTIEALD